MGRIKRYFESLKSCPNTYIEGVYKDLDKLGFSYDKKEIKRYYKSIKIKGTYLPGVSIKNELEQLKKANLVKPNLKKILINNKKRISYLTFELHKNKHLLLLNDSMLELSYKECGEMADKRKQTDYHFDYLLEDLNLQVFYEDRKIQEIEERIELLAQRIGLLNNIIDLKISTNSLIDDFIDDFNKERDSKDAIYPYEIEASNILNEKKYTEEDINNDKEDLETTNAESKEMESSKNNGIKKIDSLKEQITRVESIVDLELDSKDKSIKKQSLKI